MAPTTSGSGNGDGDGTHPMYEHTIVVIVTDPEKLKRAAEVKAAAIGIDIPSWRADRKGPGTDLVVMLDPVAAPPGCVIRSTAVDEL